MKKIITLLMLVMLLTSCGIVKTGDSDSTAKEKETIETGSEEIDYYMNLLYSYEAKDKNYSNTTDNEEFEEYLDEIFLDTIGSSYFYMHNNISDYRALGVEKPEVTWGEVSYDISTDLSEYVEELEELKNFDYDSLSVREQYYYDMYEYSLLETIASLFFNRYETLFSEGNDALNNIFVSMDEFKITDKEYLDDYMILLADVDRYLDDLLTYTEDQMKDDIYHSDDSIEYSVDYAEKFVSKTEDNALITSFSNKVDGLDFLSEAEKEEYKAKDREIVLNEIIPAYERAIEFLNGCKGKLSEDKEKLCDIDENYAKVTYLLNTSSNKSIDEIFEDTETVMIDLLIEFISALDDEEAINEYYAIYESESYGGFGLSDEETLEYLKEHIKETYPAMDDIQYTVSRLDETSASDSTVAYYVSPQLDALDENVIRTNPNSMGVDVVNDYMVLAHEGLPGHMYQNAYYQSTNPNRFTSTQGFIGYTEGYACYAMIDAFDYAGIQNENTKTINRFFCIYFYLLESLCDIGVNVYGWDVEDVAEYLEEYYPYELYDSAAESIYSSSISRPGTMVSYGVGYVEFKMLRDKAEKALGDDFNLQEYNKVLLDEGPLPLVILEDKVSDYIEENCN